jgi:peptidoglycan/xylan/chitin deacetylase (PgdA/CDA1 family)
MRSVGRFLLFPRALAARGPFQIADQPLPCSLTTPVMLRFLISFGLFLVPLGGQAAPATPVVPTAPAAPLNPSAAPATREAPVTPSAAADSVVPPPAPVAPPVVDDGVQVAVLGYHEFSSTAAETAMLINTAHFRKQMQVIKDLALPVIPMADFEAWKRGEKNLPPKAVVLTLDDGWKSVYTEAYPILKEFGFPFTLFLYKNYVDGGGKALTTEMIREMMQNGATIGSHSASHPYPATIRKFRKDGEAAFARFLNIELGESKRFLEEHFGIKTNTFAYPGGYYTDEMIALADQIGYQFLFTVQPAKVRRTTPNSLIPRYIVLGNHDRSFELAVTFRDSPATQSAAGTLAGLTQTTPFPVVPEAGSVINTRLPIVSADLSSVQNLDPATVKLAIAGFGQVPAEFDPATSIVSWHINRRLRDRFTQCVVTYRLIGATKNEPPVRWSFQIDRDSAYLPGAGAAETLPGADAIESLPQ